MFAMHARQRILICRLGFIALCVLPTLAVGGWLASLSVVEFRRPTKDEWQHELTNRLGLLVEIERASQSSLDTARLENVRLLDPETRGLVAQARAIEIGKLADGWGVSVEGASIEVGQLNLAARTLEHRVLRGPPPAGDGKPYWAIALFPSDVILHGSNRSQTLRSAQGALYYSVDSANLQLEYRLPDAPGAAKPGRFSVYRKRAASPPETAWQVSAGGHPFPCAIFQELAPQLARLGPDCAFAGNLQLVESPYGRSGAVAGTFTGIDLDALVTEQFAHQLSGLADAEIASASIAEGKLVDLSGTLRARNGAISPSLLAAGQEHLGLELLVDTTAESGQAVSFSELAFAFQLDSRSLRLSSIDQSGILLAGDRGPMLAAPSHHATAAVNLLRALVPDNQYQVPATRQTGVLVGLLPVPDFAPARTAALPGHTPTRLRTSGPADAAPVLHEPGLR
jgi:hypothetical protein